MLASHRDERVLWGGRIRMKCVRRALPVMILLSALAVAAAAPSAGRPFEFSAGGGLFAYDTRARLKDSPAFGASAGWRLASWVTFEVSGLYGSTDSDTMPTAKSTFTDLSGDFYLHVRPAEDRVVPFVIVGMGLGRSKVDRGVPEVLERGAPSLGLGARFNLRANPRTYLR